MNATRIRLGGPGASCAVEDALRGGDVVFESPRGLAIPQRLLVEALPRKPVRSVLCGMDTEGAAALAAAALLPDAEVRWFHLDLYVARKVAAVVADNGALRVRTEALEDPPTGPFDLVALAFPSAGEALLRRDLLEAAHDALAPGGRLVTATDGNGAGLRKDLEKVFGKATPAPPARRGAAFYAERRRERPARSDHSHALAPTVERADGGGTVALRIETRPGTFSHGALDRGTRALLERMRPEDARSVLDLGAGCGVIGIFAALLRDDARVAMVESNLRAAGCARRNVERNGVAGRVEVLARADLEDLPRGEGDGWDLCLSNPPYFGDFRIARSFVASAHRALRPGGRLSLVVRAGRAAEEHAEVVREVFGRCVPSPAGDYAVLTAVRR